MQTANPQSDPAHVSRWTGTTPSGLCSATATDDRRPRILIVRLSAIGDVIHGMPIACALRERFPDALLTWVVEERAADVLRGHAALDQLIVLRHGWLKWPATVWRLRRQLRAMRLDVAVDVQGLSKAAIAAWLSGAKRRIGPGGSWGRELSPWLNTELVDGDGLHPVQRGLSLLRPLGIESPVIRFQVPDFPADRAAAADILRRVGLDGPFVLVASGAGWPSKLWPLDRHAAVAAYLGQRRGLPSLLTWGSAEERARAEAIAAAADRAAPGARHARVAPKMTLLELAALARRARFCLGADTGPLHLAAAAGAACVGLYGPWPGETHGPWGPQHVIVQKMCFEGSTRQRRRAGPACMEAIDVASVCAACDRLLARNPAAIPSEHELSPT
ncbi:MAG: glycosyltransferase family 9 protein [Thermoguttaceae bacterium]